MDKKTASRLIVRNGIEPVIVPLGFERTGKPTTWRREAGELYQLIGVLHRYSSHDVQWALGSKRAVWLMWGDMDSRDIGSNVVAGLVKSSGAHWRLELDTSSEEVDRIAGELRADLPGAVAFMDRFQTRRSLWSYLLAAQGSAGERDFQAPWNGPIYLSTVAALALDAHDQEGCSLTGQALELMKPFKGRDWRQRASRLRMAAAEYCR